MRRKGPKLVRLALAVMLILVLLPLTMAPAFALPALSQAETIKLGTISATGTITETAYYRYGATATIILKVATDGAGAGDPDVNRENTASVTVTSTTDTTGAAVTLKETGLNTGILTGTVTLYGVTTPATAPPAGQVLVTSGDTVTVTVAANKVVPPATGSGAPTTTLTDTATIDNVGPVVAITAPSFTAVGTAPNKVDTAYIKSVTGGNYYDLGGTVNDATSTSARVDVSTDGGTTYFTASGGAGSGSQSWGYRWFLPADGIYVLKVKGVDSAGNERVLSFVSTAQTNNVYDSSSMAIKVDNTKPVVSDVATTPAKAHKGTNIKVTAKVADPTSGVAAGSVVVDLAAIGGSTTQTMYDDATHGDTTSADGIWTISDVNNDATADVGVGNTLGTFTLTVKATDRSGNSQTATVSVEVVDDTTAPTVVSFTAAGVISGGSARVGDEVLLTVKASDDLSGISAIAVETKEMTAAPTQSNVVTLNITTDLVTGTTDTWSKKVTVPASTTAGAKTLTVTVTDGATLTKTGTASVTVAAALTSYQLNLRAGWNLVSTPSRAKVITISTIFKDIKADIERISTYSASEGRWRSTYPDPKLPAPGWATALVYLEPGQGYYIKAKKATSVVITLAAAEVEAAPPTYDLAVGWNLIGFASLGLKANLALSTYLRGLSVIAVYGFDATAGLPTKLDSSLGANNAPSTDTADLGKGYWVYLDKAGKLVP